MGAFLSLLAIKYISNIWITGTIISKLEDQFRWSHFCPLGSKNNLNFENKQYRIHPRLELIKTYSTHLVFIRKLI